MSGSEVAIVVHYQATAGKGDEVAALLARHTAATRAEPGCLDFVALRSSDLQPCAPVCGRLEKKLLQVRQKLTDLRTLQRELQTALRACTKELHRRNARCPLLSRTKQSSSENVA